MAQIDPEPIPDGALFDLRSAPHRSEIASTGARGNIAPDGTRDLWALRCEPDAVKRHRAFEGRWSGIIPAINRRGVLCRCCGQKRVWLCTSPRRLPDATSTVSGAVWGHNLGRIVAPTHTCCVLVCHPPRDACLDDAANFGLGGTVHTCAVRDIASRCSRRRLRCGIRLQGGARHRLWVEARELRRKLRAQCTRFQMGPGRAMCGTSCGCWVCAGGRLYTTLLTITSPPHQAAEGLPKSCPSSSNSGRVWSIPGQACLSSVEFGPNLAESDPNLAVSGQCLLELGQSEAKAGRFGLDSGHIWPHAGRAPRAGERPEDRPGFGQ